MPRTIKGRLALYLSLLMALLLASMLAVTAWLGLRFIAELRPELLSVFEEAQTFNEERALVNSARYLSNRLFPAVYALDIAALNAEIEQIRRWLPARSFLVTDETGRILTDGTDTNARHEVRRLLPDRERLRQAPDWQARPGGGQLTFAIDSDELVVGYAVVSLSDTGLQGSLQTLDERVTSLWAHTTRSVIVALIGSLLAVAIVAVLFIWRLSRSLTNPISEMIEAASAYASGNLEVELPVRSNDEVGRLALALNSMARELRKNSRQLYELANYDRLTGLANRNLFQDRLRHALRMAARSQAQVGLLFLDLDGFKEINDALGHSSGDEILKIVAARLRDSVRKSDTVARLGGDEFTVIAEGVRSWQDVDTLAAKLLGALAQPYAIRQRALYLSASIGITLYPRDGANARTLVRNADTAMYLAKEEGKNTARFFGPELDQRANERLGLEQSLRQAIERNEFALHYQPQIHSVSGALIGVEALLRWHSPGGLVQPGEFIPVLEETGLITRLTAWVIAEACQTAARWRARDFPSLRVSINLSVLQLQQTALLAAISQSLAETGIAPEALEIEITETTLLHAERGQEIADALQQLGVRLAIDDFGTGYSSLVYLHRYSVDTIKIDRSFVRDVVCDRDSGLITGAVIALARQLGIETVAEGIETPAQYQLLRDQGCDMIQGYLVSRPLPAPRFLAWSQERYVGGEIGTDTAAATRLEQGSDPCPKQQDRRGGDRDQHIIVNSAKLIALDEGRDRSRS